MCICVGLVEKGTAVDVAAAEVAVVAKVGASVIIGENAEEGSDWEKEEANVDISGVLVDEELSGDIGIGGSTSGLEVSTTATEDGNKER